MARRRNSIAKRFAKMKGLPPEEKLLMQRIANLMDAALNNRQASNPFEDATFRLNRQVYPPTGLLAKPGISSVKLVWDPANSNEHLRYEIEFLNLTTGESLIKSSYINFIVFRGDNGTYLAKVSSVGRDGSKSTVKQVEFQLGSDVMLIEGAKNGALELGTVVQDNLKLYKGFSVYIWGSVVLDKQTLDTNNKVVFRLYRAETADATWGQTAVTLEQTITLYPATESGSDLDTTARAGLISRPIAVRPGAFETTQSVMFSPIAVPDRDNEKTVTYFLQTLNRGQEQDEVALSLTMWAGMDGVGSATPGDSWVPPTPYVWPNLNSFHNQIPGDPLVFPFDRRTAHAVVNNGYSLIGNEWTVAIWIRFDDLSAENMALRQEDNPNNSGNMNSKFIFSRGDINDDNDAAINQWRFQVRGQSDGSGGFIHQVRVLLSPSSSFGGPLGAGSRQTTWDAATSGDRNHISAIFPYGDAIQSSESAFDSTNNGWYFMVFCFGGGDFTDSLNPKLRLYINMATDPITGQPRDPPAMARVVPTNDASTSPIIQDDKGTIGYQFGSSTASFTTGMYWATTGRRPYYMGDLAAFPTHNMAYNQIGIWNVALDSTPTGTGWNIAPIKLLYNGGHGTEIDWKLPISGSQLPSANYTQNLNLVHLIQFGAVEKAFSSLETLRDTGYFLPKGDLNFTTDTRQNPWFDDWYQPDHELHGGIDRFHQLEVPFGGSVWYNNLGQSWSRGADIYDILSPTGSNNTTKYDWAYPGQNLPGATNPWPPV